MTEFTIPEDIASRALTHCRLNRIYSFSDHNAEAHETGFVYDKLRVAELRRNLWRFATRRCILRPLDVGTIIYTPPAYVATTTYPYWAVVVGPDGEWWQSQAAGNVGNALLPGAFWQHYYGNDTADPYDYTNATSYFAGEMVIVPSTWSSAVTYSAGATVAGSDGRYYVSLQGANINNSPAAGANPTWWQLYQAWSTTASNIMPNSYPVSGISAPLVYLSLASNNMVVPGPNASWLNVTTFDGGTTNGPIGALHLVYPIGAGPARNFRTGNVYRLPHGYLRQAPQDPKAGINPYLGVPPTLPMLDWLYESKYFVSFSLTTNDPKLLRYVADVTDVLVMDPMFCEGLAARIAKEVAPALVKDANMLPTILKVVEGHYEDEMAQARAVNGIEIGEEEQPTDDYIVCRF